VVERGADAGVATFFAEDPLLVGRAIALGESEAHHARVRRLAIGDRVRLADGAGTLGDGKLVRLTKHQALVELDEVQSVAPLPEIHLLVPIADRERMLWLAEKATELGVTSWRPVMWRRSRSVSPRGEGIAFQGKLRARMIAAMTQSGGAWLPTLHPDATVERAAAAAPTGARLLLERDAPPLVAHRLSAPVTIVVGPEGGVEESERALLLGGGFSLARLGPLTLRFETAGVVACGAIRSALTAKETADG
jgi:16S rRNA (uracil1498-N3)-methyltransferase